MDKGKKSNGTKSTNAVVPPVTPKSGSSPRTMERSEQNELKEDDMPLSQLAVENRSRLTNKLEMNFLIKFQ